MGRAGPRLQDSSTLLDLRPYRTAFFRSLTSEEDEAANKYTLKGAGQAQHPLGCLHRQDPNRVGNEGVLGVGHGDFQSLPVAVMHNRRDA